MGSFGYLVNHDKKIYVEAFKFTGANSKTPTITNDSQLLSNFMEYCWRNDLKVEIVDDGWFNTQDIQNVSDYYQEFSYL